MKDREVDRSQPQTRRDILRFAGKSLLARAMFKAACIVGPIETSIYLDQKTEIDTTGFPPLRPEERILLAEAYSERVISFAEYTSPDPKILTTGFFSTTRDQATLHSIIGNIQPDAQLHVL
ncbi:MAG: hypothetical protein AAB553_02835 [Patescibacteria group bacterium]